VFFPAYNAEVIVVNDGSRDQTAEVLDRSRQRHGEAFRVITHRVNCGYGVALGSGFAAARKEFLFYTVGDGQYDIRELPILLDRMAPDLGTANGFKLERKNRGNASRSVISTIASRAWCFVSAFAISIAIFA